MIMGLRPCFALCFCCTNYAIRCFLCHLYALINHSFGSNLHANSQVFLGANTTSCGFVEPPSSCKEGSLQLMGEVGRFMLRKLNLSTEFSTSIVENHLLGFPYPRDQLVIGANKTLSINNHSSVHRKSLQVRTLVKTSGNEN